MLATMGCDEAEALRPTPSTPPTPVKASNAPKQEPFALPDPSTVKLEEIGPWVDRGRSKLPSKQIGKLDAWLKEAVHMPVEVRGESRKTLSETKELRCGYSDKLTCSFPGKLSTRAKYFVASTLLCVGKDNEVLKLSDWKIPPKTKRGQVVDLPVDETLLRTCWEQGGTSLRMEVVGSPCIVPFPRQVRCAGEYKTGLHRCKGVKACEQKADRNRRRCLSVCKK